MKVFKKQISITLDAPVLKEIRMQAQKTNRTLSGYINFILKTHIESQCKDTE